MIEGFHGTAPRIHISEIQTLLGVEGLAGFVLIGVRKDESPVLCSDTTDAWAIVDVLAFCISAVAESLHGNTRLPELPTPPE